MLDVIEGVGGAEMKFRAPLEESVGLIVHMQLGATPGVPTNFLASGPKSLNAWSASSVVLARESRGGSGVNPREDARAATGEMRMMGDSRG